MEHKSKFPYKCPANSTSKFSFYSFEKVALNTRCFDPTLFILQSSSAIGAKRKNRPSSFTLFLYYPNFTKSHVRVFFGSFVLCRWGVSELSWYSRDGVKIRTLLTRPTFNFPSFSCVVSRPKFFKKSRSCSTYFLSSPRNNFDSVWETFILLFFPGKISSRERCFQKKTFNNPPPRIRGVCWSKNLKLWRRRRRRRRRRGKKSFLLEG